MLSWSLSQIFCELSSGSICTVSFLPAMRIRLYASICLFLPSGLSTSLVSARTHAHVRKPIIPANRPLVAPSSCTSTLYIPWRCRQHVILSDRIDVPYKNAVRGSLANRVFGASIAILALAKVQSLASCLSGSLADDPTRRKWSRTNVPWIHVRVPRARCLRRRSEERVRLFFAGSRWHRRT